MSKLKELELIYLEKGTFQGGEEDCFVFGAKRDKEYIFIEKLAYKKLQAKADKLADILEALDQRLCERIIDSCGYKPENESKEGLIDSMLALSKENEEDLETVRQALKDYRGAK